jgi:hypothetical protein
MEVKFFEPTFKKGRGTIKSYDCYISWYLKGKNRKSSRVDFIFKRFLTTNKLAWKYIRIGIMNNDIIIMEGTKENGYLLSNNNKSVSNITLITEIIKFLDYRIPKNPDEQIKIDFKIERQINFYKLIKL